MPGASAAADARSRAPARRPAWLACRLPEAPLVALAELAGTLWYRIARPRGAGAATWRAASRLAGDGRGTPLARAARHRPRALERLVRLAFRHAARYYLEVARTPGVSREDVRRACSSRRRDVRRGPFTPGPAIFVGLHFGAIELPALFLASRVGWPSAPMETSTTRSCRPGSSDARRGRASASSAPRRAAS